LLAIGLFLTSSVGLSPLQASAADSSLLSSIVGDGWRLTDGAGALPPLKRRAPLGGDVIFSTRFKRENSVEMARAFGATRVEWVYSSDPAFIQEIKASGALFGATINANPKLPSDEGYARDFDGRPLVAPWMVHWGAKWATTTHPVTQQAQFDAVKRAIDAGADSIQHDDWKLQSDSVHFGGDFDERTLAGFREYLAKQVSAERRAELGIKDVPTFDYRRYLNERFSISSAREYANRWRSLPTTPLWMAYMRESIKPYFRELRSLLDTYRGKYTPLSMNVYEPAPTVDKLFMLEFADYAIGEMPTQDNAKQLLASATMRAAGIGFSPSLIPKSVAEARLQIARYYALGAAPVVPWDVYMPDVSGSAQPRYFGRLDDYADLYRFVRSNPGLFNGWDQAPVVGIVVPVGVFKEGETLSAIRALAGAQVPFTILFSSGGEVKPVLDAERLARLRLIVRVNPISDFPEVDRKLFSASRKPVIEARDLTRDLLRELAPVSISGTAATIQAIPRLTSSNRTRLIVHFVPAEAHGDRNSDGGFTAVVRPIAQLGPRVASATWYSAKGERLDVAVEIVGQNFSFKLPGVREWGILDILFSG